MLQAQKDVSIEYAHIYTNSHINEEHELSLEVLGKLKTELSAQGKTFSLVILVDDYSFPDPTFNYDDFAQWLTEKSFKPDLIFRESQLIPMCDEVLAQLHDKKLHENIVDYVKAKKYPCSLFIAAWYMLRLGAIQNAAFPEELVCHDIISILPESFKPFEDKALEILAATDMPELVDHIEHSYIEGRLVA